MHEVIQNVLYFPFLTLSLVGVNGALWCASECVCMCLCLFVQNELLNDAYYDDETFTGDLIG